MKAQEYIDRLSKLDGEFNNTSSHLQEVSDLVFPKTSTFTSKRAKGDKRNLSVYDSTPVHANSLLAAGLHGMMTNPAARWFSVRAEDDRINNDRAGQEWLESVTKILYSYINSPRAGFSNNIHEFYLEYGAFGTALLFVGEQKDGTGLLFNCRSLTECRIAEDSDGFVDTVFRTFPMTVRQMALKWGVESLSKDAKRSFERKEYDREVKILHAVQPRMEGKGLPVDSCYIECDGSHIIKTGGFHEMPYMVGRFYRAPGETYGRSPGTESLPFSKMLNEMMKTTIKAAQKIVDPPLMMPDDGFLGPVRTMPSSINYYRAGSEDRIEPLLTGGNIPVSLEMMDGIRNSIREMFYNDQMHLGDRPQMTATETIQRTEDRLRLLGPVLGRMQSEVLGPMIDRVFGMLVREKVIPPAPPEFKGASLKIEYESPIAKSQQQLEANSILRTMEVLMPLMDRKPEMIEVWDTDFLSRNVGYMFNISPKSFLPQEIVEEARAQRQEQAQMAQEVQTTKDGALAANQLAQGALSASQVGK